jgi:hypothetical protein
MTFRKEGFMSSRVHCLAAVVTLSISNAAAGFSACGSKPAEPIVGPSPPPVIAPATARVFGRAYEHTPDGVRPVAGMPVLVNGRFRGGLPFSSIDTVTDATGGFEVSGLEPEFGWARARRHDTYLSPCRARAAPLLAGEPLNLHVISRSSLLAAGHPRSMPPFAKPWGYSAAEVLSGFVMERSGEGMLRPVAEAAVEHFYSDFYDEGRGDPTGFTITNNDGYYVLCWYAEQLDQLVVVRKPGYRTVEVWVPLSVASSRIDFELIRQ